MAMPRKSLFAAASLALAGSLVGASCGVAANDVAATYRDTEISTAAVDALAADEATSQLVGYTIAQSESIVDGASARSVLDFLLQGEALIDLAEELGYTVEADDALLAQTLQGFQSQGFPFGPDDLSDEAHDFLGRFLVADQALLESGGQLGPPSEAELRFAYAETADSGRWERTCVTLVASAAEEAPTMADALDEGAELTELVDVVPQSQLVLDSSAVCATGQDLAQLPPELADEIGSAESGVLVGPLEVDAGAGGQVVVFFEVGSREALGFDEARAELEAEVGQSLLAVRIARESRVNPRYGDGPVLVAGSSPDGGASLVATVERPEAPEAALDFGVQVP